MALWFFHPGSATPTAEPIVMHWNSAAAYRVATLRGALGRHRDTPHALTLCQLTIRGWVEHRSGSCLPGCWI